MVHFRCLCLVSDFFSTHLELILHHTTFPVHFLKAHWYVFSLSMHISDLLYILWIHISTYSPWALLYMLPITFTFRFIFLAFLVVLMVLASIGKLSSTLSIYIDTATSTSTFELHYTLPLHSVLCFPLNYLQVTSFKNLFTSMSHITCTRLIFIPCIDSILIKRLGLYCMFVPF